jgi:hypothetical protein
MHSNHSPSPKFKGTAEAEENLALWVSSGGKRLPNRRVRVKAKRLNDAIHALIIPI